MKFLRRDWFRYGKFKRKKKQKWKKPTGRDNKMREKRKGYPAVVSIGYKKPKNPQVVVIRNIKELEKIKSKKIIVGKISKKNRAEIIKKAEENEIMILNKSRERKNVQGKTRGNEK